MTILLRLNPGKPNINKIRLAARKIRSGGIVVFPTETIYGIGANALNEHAARKIFKIKGRPSDNPLIVHVSSIEMAQSIAKIPKNHLISIKKAWPSPLTIIFPAKKSLPKVVTGGLNTVAVRMPDNKIAISLIREAGVPIAGPSANISTRPSSTNFGNARKYFDGKVDVIIDGGKSKFGLESTVLDLKNFEILRPGAFIPSDIKKIFGKTPGIKPNVNAVKVRSPGTKYQHYAPLTSLFLFTGNIDKLPNIIPNKQEFTFIGTNESCKSMGKIAKHTIKLGKRANAYEIASNLFDALIKLDSTKSKFAVIESFQEKGIGLAIMNRLRKASSGKSFKNKKELEKLLKGA